MSNLKKSVVFEKRRSTTGQTVALLVKNKKKTVKFFVDVTDNVDNFRLRVGAKFGIHNNDFAMLYDNKVLEDGTKLLVYGFHENALITII